MTNDTHDATLRSWVESANDPATDFPIQNLPFGIAITRDDDEETYETAVAIGDQVLLVSRLVERGLFEDSGLDDDTLIALLYPHFEVLSTEELIDVRRALIGLLHEDSGALRDDGDLRREVLRPMRDVEMALPTACMNYTDFYASLYHATNVGSMFRPDNPLLPNYKHIPIAYHGRASSIVPSGTPIRRPSGQTMPVEGEAPVFGPCRLLDYELEVGIVIGRGNEQGAPIHIAEAPDHIFGMCL
ncbi:MAG: fumarylacetoacetate hydrolase family protein, partial [Phycisphaerales bacterium]|nr:fumarylacetoacetate hydrolase family protein [Phycisphaerales bacterium]